MGFGSLGFRVQVLGFRFLDLGFRVRVCVLRLWVRDSGCRVHGLDLPLKVEGSSRL